MARHSNYFHLRARVPSNFMVSHERALMRPTCVFILQELIMASSVVGNEGHVTEFSHAWGMDAVSLKIRDVEITWKRRTERYGMSENSQGEIYLENFDGIQHNKEEIKTKTGRNVEFVPVKICCTLPKTTLRLVLLQRQLSSFQLSLLQWGSSSWPGCRYALQG